MTPDRIKNAQWYCLYAFVGALVTTGVQLGLVLSGDAPVLIRPLLATFTTALFGALATALGASTLTRYGSEPIAHQVNDLREQGVHRKDMVVLPRDEAIALAAAVPPIHPDMTPGQTDQLLTLIHRVGPVQSIVVLNDAVHRAPAIDPAPSQADATLDALDLPEPGHGGRG